MRKIVIIEKQTKLYDLSRFLTQDAVKVQTRVIEVVLLRSISGSFGGEAVAQSWRRHPPTGSLWCHREWLLLPVIRQTLPHRVASVSEWVNAAWEGSPWVKLLFLKYNLLNTLIATKYRIETVESHTVNILWKGSNLLTKLWPVMCCNVRLDVI